MLVRFWGVRGSTPTPQAESWRYGGNTACVEVRAGGSRYIFDCGTGLRALGQELVQEAAGQPVQAHVFVSHFHWDHIQGIPFFAPLYENPGYSFAFHASARNHSLERVMEQQMSAPYFPVGVNEMKARREFLGVDEGPGRVDDNVTVGTKRVNQPQ